MKTIYKIAKTELQILFYSPVAWLILIIFAFQASAAFNELFTATVRRQYLSANYGSLTLNIFGGTRGLFTVITSRYLYLYIPLLTMGIMSRELRSGSIKLLYSSPLTNNQIILGKYLALVIYAFVMIAALAVFGLYGIATIRSVDLPVMGSGLLGIFLVICAYAAIGLFMSSLTSYAVVAAMGTMAIFALLNYTREIGQDIAFVRDITYWLAISGRSNTFISGMITTEDVLYFLIVIALFISFTIIKLQAGRQHTGWLNRLCRYAGVFCIAMLMGYVSARPSMKKFVDVTRTKENTLTKSSQEVMNKLTGDLTINTYVNMLEPNYNLALPTAYKMDVSRFQQYTRFKPDSKLNYFYYYHRADNPRLNKLYSRLNDEQRLDTLRKIYSWNFDVVPYKDIKSQVDLAPEKFRFVRQLELSNGKKTFLRVFNDMNRVPSEAEITAALKRLVMDLPVVGFVTGHGERASNGVDDRGYNMVAQEKTFRYSLINQGFDFTNVNLAQEIPANIKILVIAELKKGLDPLETQHLGNYIRQGGNLIIAGEPGRQQYMNPVTEQFGVQFLPGTLVQPTGKFQSDLLFLKPSTEAAALNHYLANMAENEAVLTMPSASGLSVHASKGFNTITLFKTDSAASWNETETTNFVDDTVILHPGAGEVKGSYPAVVGLTRKVNGREQKILITGDADWLSNGELGHARSEVKAYNFSVSNGAFFWLSDGEVPIDMHRDTPTDGRLRIDKQQWGISAIFLQWVFPCMLIIAALIIWIRRRGR